MPKRATKPVGEAERYWTRRVGSAAFKRRLHGVVAGELRELSGRRVEEVVDAARVRRALREADIGSTDRDAFADLLLGINRRTNARLRRKRKPLREILGAEMARDIEAAIGGDERLPYAEDLVRGLMEQEFVRSMLTDLVFSAIAAFYSRVNPLFGAMTTRMLEDQIKGFIRLFMPTLQRQAVAFATSRANQRLLLDVSRNLVREILDQPLSRYADIVAPPTRRENEALLRSALHSRRLDSTLREAAVGLFDDAYAQLRTKRVRELADLEERAGWLTDRIVEVLQLGLARSSIAEFFSEEAALAAGALKKGD